MLICLQQVIDWVLSRHFVSVYWNQCGLYAAGTFNSVRLCIREESGDFRFLLY